MIVAVIVGFFALYVSHFAVQAGIGNWAPTVMERQSGLEASTAVLVISGFWLMLVIGRFSAAALTRQVAPSTLVVISSLGLTVALALTILPGTAPWAYLAAGLFVGPIFPTGLAWMSISGYGGGNNLAYVIAGSMLGMALAPSLVGAFIEQQGAGSAPMVLLAIAVLVLLSSLALLFLTTGARGPRRTGAPSEHLASTAKK